MSDSGKFPYWSVVKFDLIVKEFEPAFMAYYDDHIIELAAREGFARSWRTRELRKAPNEGLLEQEFCQIYHISDPQLFKNSTPNAPVKPATESEQWRRDLMNWGRVFYRTLASVEKDTRAGRCWARFEVNFQGKPEDEVAFRADHARHMAEVLKLAGIHRGWQLQHHPHDLQIGPAPAGKYMAVYEVDAPENIFDPSLGAERMPWESKAWGQQTVSVQRHFAALILAVTAAAKS